ncbi:MAG: 4Fe-4S dicluster domain-containing protein, partial [Bacillota bacterium]
YLEGREAMGHLTHARETIFRALAERLDKYPTGAPFNQTLLEILYKLYTETEAGIGAKFPLQAVPLDRIVEITGIDAAQLADHLENMAGKGLIIDVPKNGVMHYTLAPLVPGFFEYTFMRTDDKLPLKELAELFAEYHHQIAPTQDFSGGDTKPFHIRAYESLISADIKSDILPYELASEMIRDAGGGSLTFCYCRRQAKLLNKDCKVNAPIEDVCTNLGKTSEWLVRRGLARPAHVDELLRVLDKTEKLGLVHMGDNVQNNPAFICHCCGCCCGIMTNIHEYDVMTVSPSNFIPIVDAEACSGCGKCAKRCHTKAIEIVEQIPGDKKSKLSVINEKRCIGCGACVSGCKNEAMALVRRKEIYLPPKNKKEQIMMMIAGKKTS